MDGYMFLKPERARSIRRARIQQLEEEHFSALLVLEENNENDSAAKVVLELERCINHHIRALNTETPAQQESLPLPESADEESLK